MKKIIFAIVVACFTISLNAQRGDQQRRGSAPNQGYKVGDKATDFELQNVDGKYYSLSDIKDAKGFIVTFTSNECPYAVMYQDRLIALHNNMAPKGYPVIAINSNDPAIEAGDSFDHMKVRSKELKFPFLYLKDEKQDVFPIYGATKTPHVFLLDRDLVVQYIGAIDDNARSPEEVEIKYVENAIMALEKGDLPNPNYTKAVGCPIKSKNAKTGGPGKRGGKGGPPSPEMIMKRMDTNGDEKISLDEAHGPLKNDFNSLDANNDGLLTSEELSQMKKRKK